MSRKFIPHPYQRIAGDHLATNSRTALWAAMGLGKTVVVLTTLENLSLTEAVYPALIIAPLRVANSVWAEETQKWHHTKHLRVVKVAGDMKAREI